MQPLFLIIKKTKNSPLSVANKSWPISLTDLGSSMCWYLELSINLSSVRDNERKLHLPSALYDYLHCSIDIVLPLCCNGFEIEKVSAKSDELLNKLFNPLRIQINTSHNRPNLENNSKVNLNVLAEGIPVPRRTLANTPTSDSVRPRRSWHGVKVVLDLTWPHYGTFHVENNCKLWSVALKCLTIFFPASQRLSLPLITSWKSDLDFPSLKDVCHWPSFDWAILKWQRRWDKWMGHGLVQSVEALHPPPTAKAAQR